MNLATFSAAAPYLLFGAFILVYWLVAGRKGVPSRGRSEIVYGTESYSLGSDKYLLEYRHHVARVRMRIYVHRCPATAGSGKVVYSDGLVMVMKWNELFADLTPKTFEEARRIARAWMASCSDDAKTAEDAGIPTSETKQFSIAHCRDNAHV